MSTEGDALAGTVTTGGCAEPTLRVCVTAAAAAQVVSPSWVAVIVAEPDPTTRIFPFTMVATAVLEEVRVTGSPEVEETVGVMSAEPTFAVGKPAKLIVWGFLFTTRVWLAEVCV